jgi:ABC-type sugar transport system ATPase subunit
MSFLEVSEVGKQQNGAWVVNKVSFSQQQHQKIAIAGETGSGKSTLLKMVAGWIQPDEGNIFFEQQRVLGPDEKLLPGHPAIAYLSQHFELRNNYRVEEILDMAQKLADDEARKIYEVCRISQLLKRRTDQLSGGEKQRIAVAQLLISSPKLLLLDEPYSNLDIIHRNILKEVIRDISEQLKITCILISHEPLDILSWADEIIVMKDGAIVQQASPDVVYRTPVNEYTAGLFGAYYKVSPLLAKAFAVDKLIAMGGKNLFVRPENFQLAGDEIGGVEAIVTDVSFLGSAYELELLVAEESINIKTERRGITKGTLVYLTLSTEDAWYM